MPEAPQCGASPDGPRIWLSETLIHTEIGVPAAYLRGKLATVARDFPGGEVLTFGFGKRHFFLSSPPRVFATFFAAIPGPGAMEVGGHPGPPPGSLALSVSPAGFTRLLAGIEESFAGDPVPIATQFGRSYFAASRLYTLAFTCNTWTAEMLASAGLPVRPGFVVTAHGVMNQAAGGCREPLFSRRTLRS